MHPGLIWNRMLSYGEHPDADILLYVLWAKHAHECEPPASADESLSIGKLSSSQWWAQVYQNSNFSLESSNFIIGNKYNELLLLKWQAHSVHLEDCLPDAQVGVTSMCLSLALSGRPGAAAESSYVSSSPARPTAFAARTQWSALGVNLGSSHGTLRTCALSGWDLVKLIIFTPFSRTCLSENANDAIPWFVLKFPRFYPVFLTIIQIPIQWN